MAKTSEFRMTKQRRTILWALEMDESHPTADEVYERVRRELPRISLGTVYRNLDVMSEQGIIKKLEFGGSQSRWDGDPHQHYHIRCICCDRVDNVQYEPGSQLETAVATPANYRVVGYHLEFVGMCAECDKNIVSPGLGKISKNFCALKRPKQ